MSRENQNLDQVPMTLEGLWSAYLALRSDFESHIHDGTNSRQLETIIANALVVRSAQIGGYKLFEAVVGPSQADYKTVAAALNAGETRIFVRNGTYTAEPKWQITNANTVILGESMTGVSITFAQDGVNSRSIYINATRASIQNMKLTSYAAGQQTLVEFGASGTYPVFKDLVTVNARGKIFDGAACSVLNGFFDNIYTDFTSISDSSLCKTFYTVNSSLILNCVTDMNFANSDCNPVDTCGLSIFIGCKFKMDTSRAAEFTINSSSTSQFSSCYFYAYQVKPNALFDNCYFENNGNAPGGFFISMTVAATRANNCQFKCTNSDNLLTITAANVQMNGNYFDGGKAMVFEPSGASILAIQFCNNNWTSSYTVAALNLRLGSVGHVTDNANVAYNTIRNNSGSFTPTITNNSANCNVTGNQLING
jgi:hypothetical protein